MSKLRRQRKARSRVDRIDGRSERCMELLILTGFCHHGPMLFSGDRLSFPEYANRVVSMDGPSEEELSSVACVRTRKAISHPMTQLYKLVNHQWFKRMSFCLSSPLFGTPRDMKTLAKRRRREFLAFESLRKAMVLHSKEGPDITCGCMSSRRALKLARRFRRKAREANEGKLRDKYGRPRS